MTEKQMQEPVAWMYEVNGAHTCLDLFEPPDDAYDEGTLHPLYTTPPAAQRTWVGLSEEEILKMAYPIRWQEVDDFEADKAINFAQMVEAKLKEKNT